MGLARRLASCPAGARRWTGSGTTPRHRPPLVEAAGLPPHAVDLVRHQADPRDPEYGRLFQLADEAA